MEIIATLRESEIYKDNEERIITSEEDYGEPRKAVRIVLFDENKKVALGYYGVSEKRTIPGYNIPGGGIDDGETVLDALVRESMEEIGCNIKNIKELGIINEYGVGKKVKHFQENYCFTAEVDGEKGIPQFTEEEIEGGLDLRWLDLDEAIEKLKNQSNNFGTRKTLILLNKAKQVLNM